MRRSGIMLIARLLAAVVLSSLALAVTPAERVVESLKKVGYFSVWGTGFAGAESSNEKVFRIFMDQKPTTDDALRLITDGTPPAKIYGLLALKELSPELFDKLSPRFINSRVEVTIMCGCSPSVQSTGSLVKIIADGKIQLRKRRE